MRHYIRNTIATAAAMMLLFIAACSGNDEAAKQTAAGVEPQADKLLKATSDLLATSSSFTFTGLEVRDHYRRNGEKTQVTVTKAVSVRRPDRIHYTVTGSERSGMAYYDGRTVSLVEPEKKMYAQANVPPTIDDTLDLLAVKYDVPMPMADLLYSNMYESVMSPDTKGQYVGEETIDGVLCHHLSYQAEVVDWQLWIAAKDQPLPYRLQIVYKNDEGKPATTITFSDWVLGPKLDDALFSFTPPADYQRIRIVGRPKPETAPESPKEEAKNAAK